MPLAGAAWATWVPSAQALFLWHRTAGAAALVTLTPNCFVVQQQSYCVICFFLLSLFYFFYFHRLSYACISIFLWHWYLLHFSYFIFSNHIYFLFSSCCFFFILSAFSYYFTAKRFVFTNPFTAATFHSPFKLVLCYYITLLRSLVNGSIQFNNVSPSLPPAISINTAQ